MEQDLILVIDMQKVYAEGGQWCCPKTETAAENIRRLIDGAAGAEVIFTRFLAADQPEGVWAKYNEENAEVNRDETANAMLDVFREDLAKYPLYTKSVYSSLVIPEVQEAMTRAKRVVVTGVVAECCVLATAMALIDAGAAVIYLTDAVAGISRETEEAVETVLAGLEPLHVQRMTVEQYLHHIHVEEEN